MSTSRGTIRPRETSTFFRSRKVVVLSSDEEYDGDWESSSDEGSRSDAGVKVIVKKTNPSSSSKRRHKATNTTTASSPSSTSPSSTAAPVGSVSYKVATTATAQGRSPSWKPGPCCDALPTPSSLSPSRPSSITMDPSDPNNMGRKQEQQQEDEEQLEQPDQLLISDSWLFKGIKAIIGELPVSEIEHSTELVASRKRIQVLAEYTWIQITKGQRNANVPFPAVYVPGQPRVWQGITTPSEPLDAESEPPAIIDEHLQRQHSFPYEPTFRVLQSLHQLADSDDTTTTTPTTTNFRHVDIVTDATTLATLFAFLADTDPTKRVPFRLELATVRGTLFLTTATHRGRGHTDKGNAGSPIPAWVAPALITLGTGGHPTGPLMLSGNHFRVVRYRLGALALVVRTKIDFALENRAPLARNQDPPFRGCQFERYYATDSKAGANEQQVLGFKTLVKNGAGRGTRSHAVGITTVRFPGWDRAAVLASKMPLLWFGRVPYVLDGVVSRVSFEVLETTKLFCAHESYRAWERQHQTSLKLMAGTLERLQGITRAAGGNCIVVGDPGERSFRLYRPAISRWPLPESLALEVWGPEDEENLAETGSASSTESGDESDLSQLSGTPSGFSDWRVEGEKMPEFHPTSPCQKGIDSRRAVRHWLDDDESDFDPSNDVGETRDQGVFGKKDLRTCTRNPRKAHPFGSSITGVLDGAADDKDEEETSMSLEEEGDISEDVEGQAGNEDDEDNEDDNIEEDFMNGASRPATDSVFALSSSPSSQDVSLADEDEHDSEDVVVVSDDREYDDNHLMQAAIELENLRLS